VTGAQSGSFAAAVVRQKSHPCFDILPHSSRIDIRRSIYLIETYDLNVKSKRAAPFGKSAHYSLGLKNVGRHRPLSLHRPDDYSAEYGLLYSRFHKVCLVSMGFPAVAQVGLGLQQMHLPPAIRAPQDVPYKGVIRIVVMPLTHPTKRTKCMNASRTKTAGSMSVKRSAWKSLIPPQPTRTDDRNRHPLPTLRR
jgi:hypothetical protein